MMNEGKILSYVWVNTVLCILKCNCLEVQVVMQPYVIAR